MSSTRRRHRRRGRGAAGAGDAGAATSATPSRVDATPLSGGSGAASDSGGDGDGGAPRQRPCVRRLMWPLCAAASAACVALCNLDVIDGDVTWDSLDVHERFARGGAALRAAVFPLVFVRYMTLSAEELHAVEPEKGVTTQSTALAAVVSTLWPRSAKEDPLAWVCLVGFVVCRCVMGMGEHYYLPGPVVGGTLHVAVQLMLPLFGLTAGWAYLRRDPDDHFWRFVLSRGHKRGSQATGAQGAAGGPGAPSLTYVGSPTASAAGESALHGSPVRLVDADGPTDPNRPGRLVIPTEAKSDQVASDRAGGAAGTHRAPMLSPLVSQTVGIFHPGMQFSPLPRRARANSLDAVAAGAAAAAAAAATAEEPADALLPEAGKIDRDVRARIRRRRSRRTLLERIATPTVMHQMVAALVLLSGLEATAAYIASPQSFSYDPRLFVTGLWRDVLMAIWLSPPEALVVVGVLGCALLQCNGPTARGAARRVGLFMLSYFALVGMHRWTSMVLCGAVVIVYRSHREHADALCARFGREPADPTDYLLLKEGIAESNRRMRYIISYVTLSGLVYLIADAYAFLRRAEQSDTVVPGLEEEVPITHRLSYYAGLASFIARHSISLSPIAILVWEAASLNESTHEKMIDKWLLLFLYYHHHERRVRQHELKKRGVRAQRPGIRSLELASAASSAATALGKAARPPFAVAADHDVTAAADTGTPGPIPPSVLDESAARAHTPRQDEPQLVFERYECLDWQAYIRDYRRGYFDAFSYMSKPLFYTYMVVAILSVAQSYVMSAISGLRGLLFGG